MKKVIVKSGVFIIIIAFMSSLIGFTHEMIENEFYWAWIVFLDSLYLFIAMIMIVVSYETVTEDENK